MFTRPSFFCSVSFGLPLLWTHPSNLSRSDNFTLSLIHIKPWQNGLASHRRCLTYILLAFFLATHLRGLAFTLVDLKLIRTQGDASFSPFGHPTQICTSWLQVICICVKSIFLRLVAWLTSRLAIAFGHASRSKMFWFCKLTSTCESNLDYRVQFQSSFSVNFSEFPASIFMSRNVFLIITLRKK